MKKIFYIISIAAIFGSFFAPVSSFAQSGTPCSAKVNFQVRPTTVNANEQIIPSGSITTGKLDVSSINGQAVGQCIVSASGYSTSGTTREYIVQIYDKISNKKLDEYTLPFPNSAGPHTLVMLQRPIVPANFGISTNSMTIVAKVLARTTAKQGALDPWEAYVLTESSEQWGKVTITSGQGAGQPTVSWTPGGTSLAVGEKIKFQPKNFTSNTTAEIKINKKSFRTGLSATALSDIQIPVDKDLFNEAVNTVEVIVNKNDGSQPTIITLANFSVAEGTGAKPGAPGSGSGGADSRLPETLYNPLPTESLTGTILTIAKGFLAIVALWAVVFIIIGGFRMVLSQGNEEAYLAAKKTITWAVLGVVVAMLSFSIIAIVQSLLGVSVPDFPDSQTPVVENKETSQ